MATRCRHFTRYTTFLLYYTFKTTHNPLYIARFNDARPQTKPWVLYSALARSSNVKGSFSQKKCVFCSPKSLIVCPGARLISKANRSRARVSLISAHASFCPIHLCRPTRKGSKTDMLSPSMGVVKRSGMKSCGCVKLIGERYAGY